MKSVSILISAILLCFLISETTAQRIVTTARQVSDFNAISISGGIDLYITQGSVQNVKIEAAEDIQKNIITEVHNGTLEVFYRSNLRLNWNNKMRAHIIVPALTKLNASGGSDVYGQGTFKINELKIGASGGSDIKFELSGAMLECTATGGSDMTLRGKVAVLKANASGGSDMDAYELQADKVNVIASGGSDVNIRAVNELVANANGGSDIYYKGNPARISKNSSGGSDITKKD